jgi:hypothetical protein
VVDELSRRLVPDELWALVAPLIPPAKTRAQGGGMSRVDDRALFTAIVFVLTSGCAWRHLPPSFTGHGADDASPVHRVDPGRVMASTASGGARRAR